MANPDFQVRSHENRAFIGVGDQLDVLEDRLGAPSRNHPADQPERREQALTVAQGPHSIAPKSFDLLPKEKGRISPYQSKTGDTAVDNRRGRSNKTMIPKTLVEHNIPWRARGKVVDNPVDGPGIAGIGVERGGGGICEGC